MKKKELCILIIVFGIMILIIKCFFNDEKLYSKASFHFDCQGNELIVCTIGYTFDDKISSIEYQVDYGSGFNLLKIEDMNGKEYTSHFIELNYSDNISQDISTKVYFQKNQYCNTTNQYLAVRNIHIRINNQRYYVDDYLEKITLP